MTVQRALTSLPALLNLTKEPHSSSPAYASSREPSQHTAKERGLMEELFLLQSWEYLTVGTFDSLCS